MTSFNGGDNEAEHSRADALLVEAIERLAPYAIGTNDEGESEPLVAAFDRLVKWYA